MGLDRVDSKISANNVKQLKKEVNQLQKNNDVLSEVIATNNLNKKYIEDLKARLAYAQQSKEDRAVDFSEVEQNLQEELKTLEVQKVASSSALQNNKNAELKLASQKKDLKKQYNDLEAQLRQLKNELTIKSEASNKIARNKIKYEQDLEELKHRHRFEEEHFELMEEALKLPELEDEPGKEEKKSYKAEDVKDLLDEYAKEFKKEYTVLMKKQQGKEILILQEQLKRLEDEMKGKEMKLKIVKEVNSKLEEDLVELKKRQKELKDKLQQVMKKKQIQDQVHDTKRNSLAREIEEIKNECDKVTQEIEKKHKMANEALQIIIQLEFEIKTYDRLLSMEDSQTESFLNQSAEEPVNVQEK